MLINGIKWVSVQSSPNAALKSINDQPRKFSPPSIGVNHLHLSHGRWRNPARAFYLLHSQSVIISCVSINEASKSSPIKKPRSNCYSANLWRMKQKSCFFFGDSPKLMTDFRACCELIISIHKQQKCAQKKIQSIGLLGVYKKSLCKQMWLGFLFFDFFLLGWASKRSMPERIDDLQSREKLVHRLASVKFDCWFGFFFRLDGLAEPEKTKKEI